MGPTQRSRSGQVLDEAIRNQNVAEVKRCIAGGTKLDSLMNPNGTHPLILTAASVGGDEVLSALLDTGVDSLVCDSNGKSTLYLATNSSDMTIASLNRLIDVGVNPNTQASNGITPLMKAAYIGDAKSCEVLLKY